MRQSHWTLVAAISFLITGTTQAADIGTAFTYQGSLENGSGPVTDTCDFQFALFDVAAGGSQVGDSPQAISAVSVNSGVFTTAIDFGPAAINGTLRYLDISVCCPSPCAPVQLSPRIELKPVPHALALPGFHTQPSPPQNSLKAPNIIGGHPMNSISEGVSAGTISGGGGEGGGEFLPNVVTGDGGTISGGMGNAAYTFSVIGGGIYNTAGSGTTVGGGDSNVAVGACSTISGGCFNNTSQIGVEGATVGGGVGNDAVASWATVSGGYHNFAGSGNNFGAEYSTVSGGRLNSARGAYSMVPGGRVCQAGGFYSLAAGHRAIVRTRDQVGDSDGDEGTFLWADATDADFTSTGPNQFLIRAGGGVGIGTTTPANQLDVEGGMAIGADYSGTSAAPPNGLLVQGSVGLGTVAPSAELEVVGRVRASRSGISGQFIEMASPDLAGAFLSATSRQNNKKPLAIMSVHDESGTPAGELDITFATGAQSAPTERMRISEGGLVGVGDTTPDVALDVVGDINYTGVITDVSDERLKENIAPVQDALAKIEQLRGVYFTMKDTPERRDVGLVAQEVQAVLPEAVRVVDPENGYLGVSYPSVIPLLVEAIKGQNGALADKNGELERLGSEISNLKSEIAELKAQMRALNSRNGSAQ